MLSLSLLSSNYRSPLAPATPLAVEGFGPTASLNQEDILFFSRRPAILTYTSRLVSLSERIFSLPLYIFGLRRESEILNIPMAESATFPKGWKTVPGFVMLELQAGQEVQVYDIRIHFAARFEGLRWMMYNHRIISFITFTSAFWFSEVLFAALGWVAVRSIFSPKEEATSKKEIKGEDTDVSTIKNKEEEATEDEPDLSDTPRTFPTYGRQPPLRYEPKVKDEDSEEYILDETAIQPLAAEADDEDEEEPYTGARGGRTDSGLGTSFSEGGERSGLARRRSKGKGAS
jgi:seipin